MAKWPIFLQNSFGNPTYVNQTNLNGKLRKKTGAKQKYGGMAHPGSPLRIAAEYRGWVRAIVSAALRCPETPVYYIDEVPT